jgi:hypothetical protein
MYLCISYVCKSQKKEKKNNRKVECRAIYIASIKGDDLFK